jgi:photosystem II stability/assembly factor-like uncharacterized protein
MTRTILFVISVVAVFVAAVFALLERGSERTTTSERFANEFGANEIPRATDAYAAMKWYNDQRAFPANEIPRDWRMKAEAHIASSNFRKSSVAAGITWSSVGPNNVGGRIRSIAIHPTNPTIIYCGSVSGGVWKSTNAGLIWTPTNDFAASLVIGSLAIHPVDPNILYAGTGEGFFNVDALRGIGVLKTTNGGATWAVQQNFGNPDPTFSFNYINKLVIDPNAPNTVYAAMLGGVWKTTDGGASWNKLVGGSPTTSSVRATDLVIDPTNSNVLYAAFGLIALADGIYKTTNGGSTWTKLTNGLPPTSEKYTRISLAIAPSSPSTLYATFADSNYYTHSIRKTTDAGASWTTLITAGPRDSSAVINNSHLGGQGWYNNVIAVHPTDPNTLYAGGINLFKSTNGGLAWRQLSDGYTQFRPYVHVDQHAIAFDPINPEIVYFGNDGGMFKTLTGGLSFLEINTNLQTTQFYSGAVAPSIPERYIGGTQDNGTLASTTIPQWNMVLGGDGGKTEIDYLNDSTYYTEYVYLNFRRSTNLGLSWITAMNGIPRTGTTPSDGTSERCLFIAPFTMDPTFPRTLVAGTYRVFRTTNRGDNWTAISQDLTGDGPGGVQTPGSVISALAIAKTSTGTVYAGTSGFATTSSRVLVTTGADSANPTWTNVTRAPLPNRYVTWIAVDPNDRDRAVVTYSGYNTATTSSPGHVFLTTNRGASWSNISGNLPDIPVNTIIIDPASPNHFVIGTDLGVFESINAGLDWTHEVTGLANVSVSELILRADRRLYAATHGRGMFRSSATLGFGSSSAMSISVHQNPVVSRHLDLFVIAAESLSTAPTLMVRVGSGGSLPVTLQAQSYRVFRGSYDLSTSGTVTLTASARDSTGTQVTSSRGFEAALFKPGIPTVIQSTDRMISVSIPRSAATSETYFTIIPETSSENNDILLGNGVFGIGPAREFTVPIRVQFTYTDELLNGRTAEALSVVRRTEQSWQPIESWVDPQRRTVSAQMTTLGTVALGFVSDGTPGTDVPAEFLLLQNFPNPFNPSTRIRYSISGPGRITIKVYDMGGREVRTLLEQDHEAGRYEVVWDGTDGDRRPVASGVYFYRATIVKNGNLVHTATGKMIMIK